MSFLKTPHLPEGKVTQIAIGERYKPYLSAPLSERGVDVIWLPENPDIDGRIAFHADMSLIHLGGERFVGANQDIVNELTNREVPAVLAQREQTPDYPNDVNLNACAVGRKLFHKLSSTDGAIRTLGEDYEYINVNQGYARCAVCVVDESSIITADAGIAKAVQSVGIDTLLIRAVGIELDGYDFGFIGGAAFKLSKNTLAFTGTNDALPDRDRILGFLSSKNVAPVFLTGRPVFDIGSAVLIQEKLG